SCGKQPSFGAAGTKTVEYRTQDAPQGMVDVKSRECRTGDCGKKASFGVVGTKAASYCEQHASDVCSRKIRTRGCDMKPLFGVANKKTAEYFVQHAKLQCGVEGDRESGPRYSEKETIGVKHTTAHPPPTKTSQRSGVSRDPRKLVRHSEITSTASKRAVARVSTAGTLTMTDIDRQKSSA
ncbi:unnamed protein product, partial [Ascophyllum nodosum]